MVLCLCVLVAAQRDVMAQSCSAPSEWFPRTYRPDNHEPTPGVSCEFYQWAWQTFLYITQAEKDGGDPRFTTFDTPHDLFSTPLAPAPATASPSRKAMLRLTPLVAKQTKTVAADSIFQAITNGVLVDPNGQAVYYGIHVNETFSQFVKTNGLSDLSKIKEFDASTPFPTGTLELKSSWRIVNPGEDTSQFFIRQALVPVLAAGPNGKLTIDASQQPLEKTVALVGLHVVGVTEQHPEFIWATFEHVQNAPDLPAGLSTNSPEDVTNNRSWTFCPQGTEAKDCNLNNRQTVHLVDAAAQTLAPKVPVFRQFPFGGDPDAASIQSLNQSVHDQLPQDLAVWKNYNLMGAIWLKHINPVLDILNQHQRLKTSDEAGSLNLANSTMETFGQGQNCFRCHDTQALAIPATTSVLAAR
jgi:hypothetical protein